jgi:nitrite reductase/ring-hydroxylating ferredoxin subunit
MAGMTEMTAYPEGDKCGECPIVTNRRRFLRDVGMTVAATLVATGLRPHAAFAALVTEVRPTRTTGASRSYAVPAANAVLVDSDNDVIITRYRSKVYAFSRRCPHKGARLVWHEDESRIFCPKHKARFTADGDHASGRRSRNLDRYGLRLQGREIVVDTDSVYREDENAQAWASAFVTVT